MNEFLLTLCACQLSTLINLVLFYVIFRNIWK